MIPNIVFIGKAGAGKTTASRVLRERFPHLGFDVISFATPLKVMLGTDNDRERLQQFGTDIVRRYDVDAWVRLFLWHLDLRTQIRHAKDDRLNDGNTVWPTRWCNDDCRFPNEIDALADNGWAIIEVTAPREVRLDRLRRNGKLQDESQLEHESETAIDGVMPTARISNVGTEDDLAFDLGNVLSILDRR